jgi:hypothetical protein
VSAARGGREDEDALRGAFVVGTLSLALFAAGCNGPPPTYVVFHNDYPSSSTRPLVVYQAYWQATSFPNPEAGAVGGIPPGASSVPESAVPASADMNMAYVVLAPGWDPTSSTPPTSFVLLESRGGFGVSLGDTLDIPIDDTTFVGNCAAGSTLNSSEADFIRQRVFAPVFANVDYDAKTCTTTPIGKGSSP